MYSHANICLYICICACICIYIYAYIYTYIHINASVYMTICIKLRKLQYPDYGTAYWHAHQDMTGIIAKKKYDKNIRIKKEFHYRGKNSGDSSGNTENEDHTEGATYVHKGANVNKEDGKKPASDSENSDDRRKQTKSNRRMAPVGKGSSHTTNKICVVEHFNWREVTRTSTTN